MFLVPISILASIQTSKDIMKVIDAWAHVIPKDALMCLGSNLVFSSRSSFSVVWGSKSFKQKVERLEFIKSKGITVGYITTWIIGSSIGWYCYYSKRKWITFIIKEQPRHKMMPLLFLQGKWPRDKFQHIKRSYCLGNNEVKAIPTTTIKYELSGTTFVKFSC